MLLIGTARVVAQAKGWHGISMTQPGCALNARTPRLHTRALTRDCERWLRGVRSWLAAITGGTRRRAAAGPPGTMER